MASSAEENYARQQAKLRQGGGAEEEEDDLHIEVPQGLPEVNPEIFRDVEPMLFKGFVYAPALINDVAFVFKSLNHHEFELLGLMAGDFQKNVSHKAVQKQYNLFLSFGVVMMDGINILSDRDRNLPQLAEMFGSLNDALRKRVIFNLSEINRRANRAVTLTEAFCLESQSRLRWAQYRDTDLMSSSVTGFEGTSKLGMNWSQLIWRAINYFEDYRETSEREWENAKFVASAMAGKGMSKVHSQDKQRRKREREDRIERRHRILRFALLNEAPSDGPSGTAKVAVARSVEELTAQLKHDLKGEKDWHDMVVEQYERRARDEHQGRIQAIRDRYAAHQVEYGGRRVVGGTDNMNGLTPDEVKFRIERRKQLMAQQLAAQASLPEMHDPKMSQFLDKWANTADPAEAQQVGRLNIKERPKAIPIPVKRGDR